MGYFNYGRVGTYLVVALGIGLTPINTVASDGGGSLAGPATIAALPYDGLLLGCVVRRPMSLNAKARALTSASSPLTCRPSDTLPYAVTVNMPVGSTSKTGIFQANLQLFAQYHALNIEGIRFQLHSLASE